MVDSSFSDHVTSRLILCSGVKTWATYLCYSTSECLGYVSKW